MTGKITHIALDMGGVVLHIDHEQAVSRFEEIGVADARQYLNPYHQQGLFGQLEGGQISAEAFVTELSKLIHKPLTHEQCLYAWLGYLDGIPQRNLDTLCESPAIASACCRTPTPSSSNGPTAHGLTATGTPCASISTASMSASNADC